MLHELLKIKKVRETSAHDALRKQQRLLEEALQMQKDKEQELADYIEWRCKEEQLLYDNILNTDVRQHDLDFLKKKVAVLREEDVALEQAVEEAKSHVVDVERELELAEEHYRKARQAVEKFEEFTKVLDEEAAKDVQRLEDLEMEEFIVRPNR
ncbi:MAG: YscO family type III secretion system apparatus protein [Candidatus Endonucleobacter bathymodioli]|uniref:YscO family type III secretion system apparatus protein n=1 Tax=Candidatus Endonucleibacter bathymodioli TaxID=539814 RepID=A0AA90SXE8_9GAMM|nr:YscO family type III secretion system apparatus protein [Candidatus Endonucleobacter bathymodioli]